MKNKLIILLLLLLAGCYKYYGPSVNVEPPEIVEVYGDGVLAGGDRVSVKDTDVEIYLAGNDELDFIYFDEFSREIVDRVYIDQIEYPYRYCIDGYNTEVRLLERYFKNDLVYLKYKISKFYTL